MKWWLRLWPWHEHTYMLVGYNTGDDFTCRCGHAVSGDDLFKPDTMMGKHWRERHGEKPV